MGASFDDDDTFSTDGSGAVTAASYGGPVRVVAADTAAITITNADHIVHFSTTGAGSHTITAAALGAGRKVTLKATAISTGTYTMADVNGGTLTFNATGETAVIYSDGTNLHAESLNGATIV